MSDDSHSRNEVDTGKTLSAAKAFLLERRSSNFLSTAGYAVLRLVFGLVLLTHGYPKLLGMPHGGNSDPFTSATHLIEASLGLPAAPVFTFAAAALETFGALAIAAGLYTRPIALAVAIEMVFICYIHAPTFVWIDGGFEYPLILGVAALFLAACGSGAFSLQSALRLGQAEME